LEHRCAVLILAGEGTLLHFFDREAIRTENECRAIECVTKADGSVDDLYAYL
jgi:hypothetical protein